ncbi:MAG: hypothetical protein ACFFE2_05170 [Candidatus Thorarchaeota archaeon]
MRRVLLVIILVLLVLASGSNIISNPRQTHSITENRSENQSSGLVPMDVSLLSAYSQLQGALDPVVIEQTGNKTTSPIHAETDSKTNVKTDLPIDTVNNWFGKEVSVNLWNLNRLYVENGSLNEGVPGDNVNPIGNASFYPYAWDAISYSPDPSMEMIQSYLGTDQAVNVKCRGYRIGGDYFYANGTSLFWTQTVNNTPYLENFILNFDYFYDRGPEANPNVTLQVYANDILLWSNTTETIIGAQWYNSGNIPVELDSIGSQFEFKIGLKFTGDTYHSQQFIEFTLDNIQFVGQITPTFDSAGINLNIGPITQLVTGIDTGIARHESYWTNSSVAIEFTSNLSYSFDYNVTMLTSRYLNSTKSTSLLDDGVHFTSPTGSSLLEFYTFVGSIPDLDDFTLIIRFPTDWENVTVYNPQGTPMTSSCLVEQGKVTIPTAILYTLGWWELHIDAPNYIRDLQTLKFVEPSSWFPDTKFRTSDISKPRVEIGGVTPIPVSPQNVNITWVMPDGTFWFSEEISGGSTGKINGSQLEFGPSNTSAGIWKIVASWTNGTEVAFGITSFELRHRTSISVVLSDINAYSGQSISNFFYFEDSDTNEFLMDPAVSIVANWSSDTIEFLPDLIHNQWVGVFNTSLVGPGTHLVVVNASRPFYENASCTFVITINYANNELTIDYPSALIGIGDTYLVTFNYTDSYDIGITNANITIDISGPADGVTWSGLTEIGNGDYSVEFIAVHSGQYTITISASKNNYDAAEAAIFLFVGARGSHLTIENGTSDIISYGEQYRLVIRYTNNTGFGLEGANITIASVVPAASLNYTAALDEGDGYYSLLLTPFGIESSTILIRASVLDHAINTTSFTLTATPISTQLRIAGGASTSSVGYSETETLNIVVFYEVYGGPPTNISLATLQVHFTSYLNLTYTITPLTEGYLLQFPTNQMGRYEFSITASKIGYQDDSISYILFVRERAMHVNMSNPEWIQGQDLTITLELIDTDSSEYIAEAVVSYRLVRYLDIEIQGYLIEISPGIYSISIRPDWYGGDAEYELRIFAEKENYALDQDYTFDVVQRVRPEEVILGFLRTVLPPIGALVIVSIVTLTGRAYYLRKKKAEFAVDLANKRRFEDADNIIGVIVMHKVSGIPIYSRIVKGGFEEGIVAAFISAVSHFREEFEMFEEDAMNVIPISDIIRAVQTTNLICAFITVRSASLGHNRMMEAFGMQVSTYLDDFYTEKTPPSAMDTRISEILNYVYDETMDGNLLKHHKADPDKSLPKRYSSIEQVLLDMESAHCSKPIYLAKAVSRFGVSEERGCTLVSEAIEKRFLIPCEEHEIPSIEVDLRKFLNGSDASSSE